MDDQKLQRQLNELRQFIEAHEDIQHLLDNSAAWADTQREQDEKSKTLAWRVAAGAGVFGLVSLFIAWTSIRTAYIPPAPPEVLVMDKTTGHVEPLVSLKEVQESVDEAVTRHYITEFMRCRENYTFDTAEDNYYCAAAFMSPQLQSQWAEYWDTANPKSPLNYYKNMATVKIDIGSITLNTNSDGAQDTASVRFTRIVKKNDQQEVTRWVATLAYKYVNQPTKEKDRRINPAGLQIRVYQVDPDIGSAAVPTPQPETPAPPPAPAPASPSAPALTAPQAPASQPNRGTVQ
ncbi:virB8 family protein [Burkholderia multivorans]|uniref:virB8 family protein n=1 Tax=Burkholderia multivorans TaxID=87883 RepID=UPI000D00FA5F|nr:type IV secretion system protein [Burkholderia multivorans]MBU9122936.1 type IV secretion system protein [Burkholderia multivorans]MDN7867560.1 type IV secretion system protein [Burkholderia multivorans]MDR8926866.1 Type IV secretion system protein virB8 [Burkholderia multivorans]MDR8969229.1 Type IV secretion system protein virB8 [Burkholderia multivorans]MDR8993309.1 Type IV secretion system protein virB8 [Burkholderia multivorans]